MELRVTDVDREGEGRVNRHIHDLFIIYSQREILPGVA